MQGQRSPHWVLNDLEVKISENVPAPLPRVWMAIKSIGRESNMDVNGESLARIEQLRYGWEEYAHSHKRRRK